MLVRLVSNSQPQVNSPSSASQSAGITGMSHCTWPFIFFLVVLPCHLLYAFLFVYLLII
uniref:Macaca fascicularis brain cDNA clone: QmoA-10446, similar to human calcium modulating ligand (CAMLG), mRNA, RefSeq: NM_001745.2 n=1 Tax=Macaca fascicularis TaxID=9541 RepID=I7G860_MACFA|nr:unnamed protein product [Macaca fascicularis]